MEGSTLILPRLRLTRNKLDYTEDTAPVAGPSRLHDEHDSDTHSTPTISAAPRLALLNAPTDTPAARLRALLAKVPNDSPERTPPAPSSSSELNSDFFPPHLNTTNTHESLKEIFSRALRDPGDTPEKPRRRRNSIDLSEVDASPRLDRVKTERAKSKGKRKSISDEELEKSNRTSRSYSQATSTFLTLRERLASSQFDIDLKDIAPPTDDSLSDTSEEKSHDTAKILRRLDSSKPSLPNVTNTLAQSIQLPSQINNQSNLLEQDSGMQRAMNNMDSYDDGEPTSPVPFPPSKSSASNHKSALKNHHSNESLHQNSHLKTYGSEHISPQSLDQSKSKTFTHSKLARHHSLGSSPGVGSPSIAGPSTSSLAQQRSAASLDRPDDARGQSPKTSSIYSHSDYKDRSHDMEREKLKERERDWNRPNLSLAHSSSNANLHASHKRTRAISNPPRPHSSHALTFDRLELHRRSLSRNSTRPDSPASSVASNFDLDKDGQNDLGRLKERTWNSPHSNGTRPVHSPTHSVGSDHGLSSPPTRRHSHNGGGPDGRRSRLSSLSSNSSRTSSPAGTISSKGSEAESKHETKHERERNWNAPQPKWNKRHSLQNMHSTSPSFSPSTYTLQNDNQSHAHERTQSLKLDTSSSSIPRPAFGKNATSTGHMSLNTTPQLMRPISPGDTKRLYHVSVPSPKSSLIPTSSSPKSNSPLLTPVSASAKEASSGRESPNPITASHFGWKFPKNKSPLLPLEHDPDSHLSVGDRPKIVRAKTSSNIPVPIMAPSNNYESQTKMHHDNGGGQSEVKKRGHRRSVTEFSEAVGSIPPKTSADSAGYTSDALSVEDVIHGSDEESPIENIRDTPLARQINLPPLSPPSQEQNSLGSPQSQVSTPPPSPPHDSEDHVHSLVTPPRQSLFSSSKVEFRTPSPQGLPELPEPPESADHPLGNVDVKSTTPGLANGNLTMMKTPKPPGSWLETPAQPRRNSAPTPTVRNYSLPEDSADGNAVGLVTPPLTLSKGNSLPQRTPAPPGGWLTPGSLSRKSILKVRFDVAPSETEIVSSVNGGGEISMDSIEMVHPSDESVVGHEQPLTYGNTQSAPSQEVPSTPVMRPARTPRSPPSVRVVDAFGRERTETPNDVPMPGDSASVKSEISSMKLPSGSPKTEKSRMRVVDAMGREIDEAPSFNRYLNGDAEEPRLTRDEAFAKIKDSVSSLAKEMSDADLSSTEDLSVDDPRVKALRDVSNVARSAREKLSQIMQRVQNAEDDSTSNYGPLREGMRRSNGIALSNVTQQPSRSSKYYLNGWTFGTIVLLQIVFMVYMFRLSHTRARELFLNNYYNPFYPDIHLHITKPDTYRLSVINPLPPWSVFNIPETFERAGFRGVYEEFLGNVTLIVSDLQRRTWEAWDDSQLGRARAWPPR